MPCRLRMKSAMVSSTVTSPSRHATMFMLRWRLKLLRTEFQSGRALVSFMAPEISRGDKGRPARLNSPQYSRRAHMRNHLDGGEAMLEALRALKVDHIFSSPGS